MRIIDWRSDVCSSDLGAFASAKDQMRANANPDSKKAADVAAKSSGGRRPRRARLRLTRIDPWSVMKAAFLLSVALGIVTIVAVTIVWGVLGMAAIGRGSCRERVGKCV